MRKFIIDLDTLRKVADTHWQTKSMLIAMTGATPDDCPVITDVVLKFLLDNGKIVEVEGGSNGH